MIRPLHYLYQITVNMQNKIYVIQIYSLVLSTKMTTNHHILIPRFLNSVLNKKKVQKSISTFKPRVE